MSPPNKSLSAVSYVSLPASEGAAVDERRQSVASGEPAHEISTVANSVAHRATASNTQCPDSLSTNDEINGKQSIESCDSSLGADEARVDGHFTFSEGDSADANFFDTGEYTIRRDENVDNEAVKLGAIDAGLKRAAPENQSK